LSLSELARLADTSAPTLSRYESNWHRFELQTLRKIARALGCRVEVRLLPVDRPAKAVTPSAMVKRLQRLFWDTEISTKTLRVHFRWVLQRVLEYGDLEDVRMLIRLAGKKRFLETVAECHFSSVRTESFWREMLRKEGMSCTTRFSREEARTCWNN